MELKGVFVPPNSGNIPNGVCGQNGSSGMLNLPSRQTSIQSTISSSSSLIKSERGHHRDRRRERLNTEMLEAASLGNLDQVRRILEEGGSANATCRKSGQSAMHVAAEKGYTDLVKALKDKGANPEARDKLGRQPVHLAAWKGHKDTLEVFSKGLLSSPIQRWNGSITEGDLDSWNHKHENTLDHPNDFTEGSTPLHLACKKSNRPCVTFLLDIGVPVDAEDSKGRTPLDVLGTDDDDLSTPEVMTETPTMPTSPKRSASKLSFDSIPFRIPNSFAKIRSEKKNVAHVIEEEVNHRTDNTWKKSYVLSITELLLNKGAKMPVTQHKEGYVRNQSKSQMTALHTAVQDDNVEMVTLLLRQNGCMLAWNEEGVTPLHVAVKNKFIGPMKAMLSWRENPLEVVDVRDAQGRTLLHLAVMNEWSDGVSLLLENGADVKTSSNSKENVFHLAAERGNAHMLEELLSVPDSIKVLNDRDNDYYSPLCQAVGNGYLDCAKLLVDNGADSTIILPGDRSLIHLAAENNFSDLLDYFINQTLASELKDLRCRCERGGLTALQLSAMLGFKDCVKILLKAGCDVRLVSTEEPHLGSNAVHLAARNGHDAVIALALNKDSDVLTLKDSRGWYPLHIAASKGYAKCVSTMIEYGADLADYIVDEKGAHLTGLEIIIHGIPQPTEFLVQSFDSYIKTNGFSISDPNCEIKVRFDVLIPRASSCKQLRVLTALLNCGKEKIQEKLLLHPIVQTFLHLKWRKLRLFFFIIMALYLIFTLSLTTLAVWYYILKNEVSRTIQTVHCILFISLVPIVLAEGLNVMQLQRYYLLDYESWVKWIVFCLSLVVGLADPEQWWARHLAACTVLLAWIELLFLVARCPNWGFYVLMFSRVAIKVLKVLVTFTFLLLGFTFSFMILFDGNGSFSTVWESIVKVFVMMIEFDYEATFENVSDTDGMSFVSRGLFLFFVVLVAIVLMNLMVGLAVSDIAVLETQGRTQRLAKQVSFLSLLEVLVGPRTIIPWVPYTLRNWAENRRTVMPEVIIKAGGATMECNDDCLPRYLREIITEKVVYAKHSKESLSTTNLRDIVSKLDKLEKKVNSASISTEVLEMKKILNQQVAAVQQIQSQLQQIVLARQENSSNGNNARWAQPIGDQGEATFLLT